MTLLEALVVVGLTVLIGAIGFPAMIGWREAMAFEAARATLVADLKGARGVAMRTGRATGLRIAGDGTRYVWAGGEVRLTDGIRLGADAPVGFHRDGTGSGATLVLTRGDKRRALRVAETGMVVPAR